jgi:hypothetical protein
MKKYKLVVLDIAKQDAKNARKWYREQQIGLDKRFTVDMNDTLRRILRTPSAYAIRYRNNRQANFDIFPYIIHFFIEETTIIVTAILYAGRDPNLAKQRVK